MLKLCKIGEQLICVGKSHVNSIETSGIFPYFCTLTNRQTDKQTNRKPTMDIPSKYNPASVEDKWYSYWMENEFFKSTPDEREPYCIVIPPPNVTGVLHMGHMLNNTLQDVLIRRARMIPPSHTRAEVCCCWPLPYQRRWRK